MRWRLALLALLLGSPAADAQIGLPAGLAQLFPLASAPPPPLVGCTTLLKYVSGAPQISYVAGSPVLAIEC